MNNKVIINDETIIDLTETTVTPNTMTLGTTALDKSGTLITGTLETEFNWKPHDGMPDLQSLDLSNYNEVALFTYDNSYEDKWLGFYVTMASGSTSAVLQFEIGTIVDGQWVTETSYTDKKGNTNIRLAFPQSALDYPVVKISCSTRGITNFQLLSSPVLWETSVTSTAQSNRILDIRVKGKSITNIASGRLCTHMMEHFSFENITKMTSLSNVWSARYCLQQADFVDCTVENVTTFYRTFQQCASLRKVTGTENWVGAKVTNMQEMFAGCTRLEQLHFNSLEVPNCTTFYATFNNCKSLTVLEIPKLNTAKATTLKQFFADCSSLRYLDVSHFVTSNVTSFERVFANMCNVEEINAEGWDISKGTIFTSLCSNDYRLTNLDLSSWTLPELSRATAISTIIYNTYCIKELRIPRNITYAISLNYPAMSVESVSDIADNIGVANGTQTLTLGYAKAKLTNAQVQAIADKGWTLA